MSEFPAHIIKLAKLTTRKPTSFRLEPNEAERAVLAEDLGVLGLRKVVFEGTISANAGADWYLEGQMGATVQQSCVVTLEPVKTRIEERVERRYLADLEEPNGTEIEIPEDDTVEPLPDVVDLYQVLREALSLALPTFPKAPDAELEESVFAEDGVSPLTDDEAKPFAGLASLKDKLQKKGSDES